MSRIVLSPHDRCPVRSMQALHACFIEAYLLTSTASWKCYDLRWRGECALHLEERSAEYAIEAQQRSALVHKVDP